MAAYMYPRVIEFRRGLPMTATGELLKREPTDSPNLECGVKFE